MNDDGSADRVCGAVAALFAPAVSAAGNEAEKHGASGGKSAAAALVADGAANAVYTVFAAGKQRFRRVSPV